MTPDLLLAGVAFVLFLLAGFNVTTRYPVRWEWLAFAALTLTLIL